MQTIPWQKIKVLQEEIKQLKSLKKQRRTVKHTKDPLYGILKNTKFSEADINEAQQEIFSFKINK